MDAFIQKFCEKYSLPIALSLQLLDNMEKFTFHKGDFLVQEGGRNSNFYIVSKGIWRGHYLNDGVDVSVWFASEGEAIFSSWGYVENTVSLVSIEAMCDSELYGISKAKLEVLYAGSVELATCGANKHTTPHSTAKNKEETTTACVTLIRAVFNFP
jgi:CRP-like cAMP-binding protein